MKDIKDYLHLYLGCNVMTGKLGKLVSVGTDGMSIIRYPDGDPRGNVIFSEHVKPILRPLSDITEEESIEVNNEGSKGWQLINPTDSTKPQDLHSGVVHRQAFELRYLLSKGFDLFGLIDSGLAISSESIQSQKS